MACLEKAKENESYIKVLDLENDFKKVLYIYKGIREIIFNYKWYD